MTHQDRELPLRPPTELPQHTEIIGVHPDGGDLPGSDRQYVNSANLHFGSGRLNGSDRSLVRSDVTAPHDECDGQAVCALHDLKYVGTQPRECRMEGSSPSDKIDKHEVCAVDSYGIGIELGEPIFQLI
jgi:hypothetical protein